MKNIIKKEKKKKKIEGQTLLQTNNSEQDPIAAC